MGCERKPEEGDADFCQRPVVSGPYSKWTERESSPWGLLFFPILQMIEILAVINTCQGFSQLTVEVSMWGFMPAGSGWQSRSCSF